MQSPLKRFIPQRNAAVRPIKVCNVNTAMRRSTSECPPLQFLREFTQNGIEAGARTVRFDTDWDLYDQVGVRKLCVIDDGSGMSDQELEGYINGLYSSGRQSSLTGNQGAGAKISSLERNPAGVCYVSSQAGALHTCTLMRNKYGDHGLRIINGLAVQPLTASERPTQLPGDGTMTTFLGRSAKDDTTNLGSYVKQGKVKSTRNWVEEEISSRYYTPFPPGVTVQVRSDFQDRNSPWITVQSFQEILRREAMQSGTIYDPQQEVTYRWFILPEKTTQNNVVASCDFLYQGERYDRLPRGLFMHRLTDAGIKKGYNRVVLLIEPKISPNIFPDAVRNKLVVKNNPDHYEQEWLAFFRRNLPAEIQQMMDDITNNDQTDQKAMKKRASKLKPFIKILQNKRSATGKKTGNVPGSSGTSGGSSSNSSAAASKNNGKKKSSKSKFSPGVAAMPAPPECLWISGSDVPSDFAAFAVRYNGTTNTVHFNEDFPWLQNIFTEIAKSLKDSSDKPELVSRMKELIEVDTYEAIVQAMALYHAPATQNSQSSYVTTLSDAALTTSAIRLNTLIDGGKTIVRELNK